MSSLAGKTSFEPVNAIREVFSYIKRFKDKIFVIHIDDCLRETSLFPILMKDIVELHNVGVKILIIPGTRETINKHLTQYGIQTTMYDGIRITTEEALPMVKLAAMEVIQDIISHLAANGGKGLMGNWVKARSMGVVDGIDYQYTGVVEKVSSKIILNLIDDGFLPVLSSLGWNSTGASYNVNSNVLLLRLCEDLDVAKVFYISDQDGIHVEGLSISDDVDVRKTGVASSLNLEQAKQLLAENKDSIRFGTKECLEHAVSVCYNDVKRVHFVSGLRQGAILQEVFSSLGGGTMVFSNKYYAIRAATVRDVPDLLKLMEYYVQKGYLVERSEESIALSIDDYYVYEVDGRIHGSGALHVLEEGKAEVAAIAVDKTYRSKGIGRDMLEFIIEQSEKKGITELFILTTQAADWFYEFGFENADVDALPKKKFEAYNRDRNSKVLLKRV
ncbi:MAG: amino-acid N-acetyltransferase [Fibrobacterales bacterium]